MENLLVGMVDSELVSADKLKRWPTKSPRPRPLKNANVNCREMSHATVCSRLARSDRRYFDQVAAPGGRGGDGRRGAALRDTNLRHRAWTAVLLGMLAMPALVCVTPAVPLPGWLLPAIPAGATVRQAGDDLLGAAAANPSPESWDAAGRVPQGADFQADAANRSAMNELQSAAAGARQPLDGLDAPKINPIGHGNPTAGHPSTSAEIVGQWPPVLAGLYFSVAGFFVARLLISLALTYQLIGRARAIHLTTPLPLPRRRGLRLLESASVQIPATVGFVRPVVLLPITWRQWTEFKLQAVLVHELAHVRRGDWLVIALAELNRAIYWFHPVAWIIRRCLAELAERNCDDAVLEADGDRTQYAHYLLEFASSLASTGSRDAPLHGIAMAPSWTSKRASMPFWTPAARWPGDLCAGRYRFVGDRTAGNSAGRRIAAG